MKKFLALGLAMMMSVAALTGCGGGSEETAEGGDAAATSGAISVVSREDGSGTRGAFIELFGIEEKNDAGEKVDMTTEMAGNHKQHSCYDDNRSRQPQRNRLHLPGFFG